MSQKRRRSRRSKQEGHDLDLVMRKLTDTLILNTALREKELETAAAATERLASRGALNIPDGPELAQSLREAHRQSGRTTNEFLRGLGAGA